MKVVEIVKESAVHISIYVLGACELAIPKFRAKLLLLSARELKNEKQMLKFKKIIIESF